MTLTEFARQAELHVSLHRGTDWRLSGLRGGTYLEIRGAQHDSLLGVGTVRYRVESDWTLVRDLAWECERFGVKPNRVRTEFICTKPGCTGRAYTWDGPPLCRAHSGF